MLTQNSPAFGVSSSDTSSFPSALTANALRLSISQAALPVLDAKATLSVKNSSSSTAIILRAQLGFFLETSTGIRHDITRRIFIEADTANPWFIPPGQSADFKFKVQFLHDTPPGKIRLLPHVEYLSQGDNLFPPLMNFELSPRQWQVENPARGFNARAMPVKGELAPPGAQSAVQLSVQDNRLKGRIALQSPQNSIQPDTEYVAGVLCKSDRAGWDSPINKGAAITEYDAKGAIRAHPIHVFEVKRWGWERLRFRSTPNATDARMEIWNRGWALKQSGQSWYGAAFLAPADKVHVLSTIEDAPFVNVTATTSPPIAFLGDDRPKAGEGGDWIGRYGNESFILCGMQAPQDVVGGRLLPKRRWTKGKDGFAPTSVVWSANQGEFFYEVLTGDEKEVPRHWIPINNLTTQDTRALKNPLEGERRYSSWDDRGEVRPFDGAGPDLIVNLEIPEGLHRLTLYFIDWEFYDTFRPRAHRVLFSDASKDEKEGLLSSGVVSEFGKGIYKVYGVSGPQKLRLRVTKDKSVCAVLSGIFLDEMNLANAATAGFATTADQSAASKTALAEYNALYKAQSTPIMLPASSEAAKKLWQQAERLSQSPKPDEAVLGEWLRWQLASSLLVAPEVGEAAFARFLALRPSTTAAAAKARFENLLSAGRGVEAKQAAEALLELSRRYDLTWNGKTQRLPFSSRESFPMLIETFAARDAAFAADLSARFVQRLREMNEPPATALEAAAELARQAEGQSQAEGRSEKSDAGSESSSHVLYRTVTALYDAIENVYGVAGLGDDGAFARAQFIAKEPGYRDAAVKRALAAYQEYSRRWPQGRHAHQAQLRIVELGCALARPTEPKARDYWAMGEAAARLLLARADELHADAAAKAEANASPLARPLAVAFIPSVPVQTNGIAVLSPQTAALSAAWQMAKWSLAAKDTAQADLWLNEIIRRTPKSELAQNAATLSQSRSKTD
jgi:hypothetical protein